MNQDSNVLISKSNLNATLDNVQSITSLSQMPSQWQKQFTLKEMKRIAKRGNAPSLWQSIRTKAEIINCLEEKVNEYSQFVQTIRCLTFEEYVMAGESELKSIQKSTRKKRRKCCNQVVKDYQCGDTLVCGVEPAMNAAVHIIPSGSGTHLGNGLILTCAHCVSHDDFVEDEEEDKEEDKIGRAVELVNARGETFGSVCIDVCNDTDLALLKILDVDYQRISLGSIPIAEAKSDTDGTDIFAVGNPCDTDLENTG